MSHPEIFKKEDPEQNKLLHRKTKPFDFKSRSAKEIKELVVKMRRIMNEANGIGLAGPQIGLQESVFVAKDQGKFYAIFNPVITNTYGDPVLLSEGCLSAPGYQGEVERYEKILLEGQDARGKKIKIKAWGLLAHIFQHETDHLNGILYLDKAKKVYKLEEE